MNVPLKSKLTVKHNTKNFKSHKSLEKYCLLKDKGEEEIQP